MGNPLELLEKTLSAACMAWDGDFKWELNLHYDDEVLFYFDVTIHNRHMPHAAVSFTAKVDISAGTVEMEWGEDSWHNLDTKNVFIFLFFEVAQKFSNLSEYYNRGSLIVTSKHSRTQPKRGLTSRTGKLVSPKKEMTNAK